MKWKTFEEFKGISAAHTLNIDKTILYKAKVVDGLECGIDKWIYLSELINELEKYDSSKKPKKRTD